METHFAETNSQRSVVLGKSRKVMVHVKTVMIIPSLKLLVVVRFAKELPVLTYNFYMWMVFVKIVQNIPTR